MARAASPSSGRRPEHPDRHVGRCGVRATGYFRRRDSYTDPVAFGQRGHLVQRLPHDGHVFADPGRVDDGTQPQPSRVRSDCRVCQRLGRLHGRDPEVVGDHRRGARLLRLRDRRLRQGSQHAGRSACQRPLRSHAHRPRLRLLLRLHCRRDVPVGTDLVGEHHADLSAPRRRTTRTIT